DKYCLTFALDDSAVATVEHAVPDLRSHDALVSAELVATESAGVEPTAAEPAAAERAAAEPVAAPTPTAAEPEPPAPTVRARIVNVRTADTVDLNGSRVVVGRDQTCDLTVSGMRVSRRHFSVAPVEGGYLLRDESANGTVVNGSRVSGTYLLGHG